MPLFGGGMIVLNLCVTLVLLLSLKRASNLLLPLSLLGMGLALHLAMSGYFLFDGWAETLSAAQKAAASDDSSTPSGQLPLPGRDAAITGTAYSLPVLIMMAGVAAFAGWVLGAFRSIRGY